MVSVAFFIAEHALDMNLGQKPFVVDIGRKGGDDRSVVRYIRSQVLTAQEAATACCRPGECVMTTIEVSEA